MEIVLNKFAIVALPNHNFSAFWLAIVFSELHVIESGVSEHRELLAQPLSITIVKPLMFLAVTFKLALQPRVQRPKVVLDIVVQLGLELVGVKYLDGAFLPPRPDRFSIAQIDLHVHHVMRERLQSFIVVCGAVEYNIAGLCI